MVLVPLVAAEVVPFLLLAQLGAPPLLALLALALRLLEEHVAVVVHVAGARLVLGGKLAPSVTLWFSMAYVTSLPLAAFPLGLLAFAVAPNYARVAARMPSAADEPSPIWRLARRALHAPRC